MTSTHHTDDDVPLDERPSAISYDHLAAGDLGYWPVILATPDDMRPGDRVSFTGDADGDVVASVRPDVVRIAYVTREGEAFHVGRMAKGFRLDRWGRHAVLSDRLSR